MKYLLALTTLFLSLNTFSSVAFTVEGELRANTETDKDLVHMFLLSEGHKVKIINIDRNIIECRSGIYEIVNNFYPEDTYSLLEVHACLQEEEVSGNNCPEIYKPVCGIPEKVECINDFCIQMEPAPKTYENYCVLYSSSASFQSIGECS